MKKLMIVDDEPDITAVLKRGLEQHRFAVDAFNDPEQALSNFKPGTYDLLVVDVRMPKLNGFDLYRAVKKKDEKVKVCFLTAFEIYYDEFRKVFPKLDVRHFIRKPIGVLDLVKQINASIES